VVEVWAALQALMTMIQFQPLELERTKKGSWNEKLTLLFGPKKA
jgi:hypothetical protein